MPFSHRPATFACDALMLGLAGPSSSGKTLSALKIATGLCPDKPIFFGDTERGRGLLYARQFKYQYVQIDPPYSPARYLEFVKYCVAEGAGCIITDSMSHEHEGEGGILEMQEAELNRMAGDNYGRREAMKFTAWIKPKAEHNRMVNGIIQQRCHMIMTFRAKEKLELVPVEKNGKKTIEPVKAGWSAICTDRFEYEMTAMLILPPGSKGRPAFSEKSTKLNDDLAAIFHDGEQLSEDHGARLRAWAHQEQTERAETAATPVAGKPRRTAAMFVAEIGALLDQAQTENAVLAIIEREDVAKAMHSDNAEKSWHGELHGMANRARARVAPAEVRPDDGPTDDPEFNALLPESAEMET
jgi:hypothetical protein